MNTIAKKSVDFLRDAGLVFVASMRGGMRAWKNLGFSTSHDKSILKRKFQRIAKKEEKMADKKNLTEKEIIEHVGDPQTIQWIKVAAFMLHGRLSCVDGRDSAGVIGTPGGDIGEFIIGLATAEKLCNKQFSKAEISTLMQRLLNNFGRFYMHTDTQSLDLMAEKMRSDPELLKPFATLTNVLAFRAFMRSPPQQYRAAIMTHQLNPDHIGCGHIRRMVKFSVKYDVRQELVLDCLSNFFTKRWDGATDIEYMALSGSHGEAGVVSIEMENSVESFSRIPLISPSCSGKQMFVSHGQISSFLRRQKALWYCRQTDIIQLSNVAQQAFAPMMELLAERHASNTLSALAGNLPLYKLRFQDSHHEAESGALCKVEFGGIIPKSSD